MTAPLQATDRGLSPHYKVRVVLPGAILHLASWTEPTLAPEVRGPLVADWINDRAYGDTIGFVDWSQLVAVTWRYAA
jgi:hypothetical protein